MPNTIRLPKSLYTVVGQVLATTGSHAALDIIFKTAGAPGDPPDLSHGTKWKEWLFRAGIDPNVDSLAVLGNVLEEFMDIAPDKGTPEFTEWKEKRARIEIALEENGLRCFRFGRILPQRSVPGAAGNSFNHSEAVFSHETQQRRRAFKYYFARPPSGNAPSYSPT